MSPTLPDLPIKAALPELLAALARSPRAVLVAPPGAGKTTLVPLALLDEAWRRDGKIIVLEPRRLAARAAAQRMAQSFGEPVGQTVGYRVRLDAKISTQTRIEVVTEGIFTRMILDDPELIGVSAVLFDEFHERSLDADLGLALALDATALRPDLRLLIMSATIDGSRIAALLGDAPTIESQGRAFAVSTIHVDRDPLTRLEDQLASTIRTAMRDHTGSALVFLPGQAEISRTAERLQAALPSDIDVAPLYGQLTTADQDRAISPAPAGRRKIVLATSIAETSLTIEDITIVIDSGLRRVPAYEPATGLTTLETRKVSRAGADQRRGRAGRTAPGVCYRLWAEGQTAALDPYDLPEILGADLSGLALDLANWGVADPVQLTFLDPPPKPAWNEAVVLLKSLDALDENGRITPIGKALARLPLHPRMAHMVQSAAAEGSTMLAAELAVLLTERGLGGDGTDLVHRHHRFRNDRSKRADQARRLARRWAEMADGNSVPASVAVATEIGRHLACAYPDRLAQKAGAPGRFRLANGRAASLEPTDGLAASSFLVVTDITGAAATGRIRAAAKIERVTIDELFAPAIVRQTILGFDTASQSVRARRVERLGALKLSDEPVAIEQAEEAANLLAAHCTIANLGWTKEQKALRARATFLNATLGDQWPDLSDQQLSKDRDWMKVHLFGLSQCAQISASELGNALDVLLPWSQRQEMDRLLPSHFDAPSGSRLPIDYATENGPAIEVRVQELFGLNQHPTIAGGRLPLLVILLSPAHRPIQTTRDLPGFWRGSWKDVAKDLKGRYPRHLWPDDPVNTPATSRAKPRGT
ncbi:ATP-dependent helicase HrpB [Devosia rhodophyticola]|uniref:ATP-dependent helicase HrpB n=1 Tax=Devosia rhodophyticola TaxID=3026423 RepID=A0ABY7YVH5_9HYPH|nr:ATP-dependent helicase HrpB [Devosia rhodophyticola]WDR04860.1 ATP-dependent helicase HrpB [Devosia rhodophyticola]